MTGARERCGNKSRFSCLFKIWGKLYAWKHAFILRRFKEENCDVIGDRVGGIVSVFPEGKWGLVGKSALVKKMENSLLGNRRDIFM